MSGLIATLITSLDEGLPSWLADGAVEWDVTATADDGARIACSGEFPLDLSGILGPWPADVAASMAKVDDLADRLTGHRPPQVVRHFPAFVPLLAAGGLVRAVHPDDAWLLAARLTEACRVVLTRATASGDLPAARLLPLVRRARFLLLSAPGRYRPRPFPTERVFGSERLLVDRARQAREEWALDLLNHDQHPVLRRWPAEQFDRDLRRLVLVHDTAAAGELLPPPPVTPAVVDTADPDDAVAWIVREGFLPRFMLADAWTATRLAAGRRWRWLLMPPSLLALSIAGLVVGFAAGGHVGGPTLVRGVAGAAAALFVAVAGLSVWRGDTVALWCLRLPAGAAIGLAALVALPVGWATPRWSSWGVAVGALAASAVGYLTLEALAHGAARRAAVTRALAVAVVGLAYGVAVAAILFAAVIPAVAPDLAATLATLSARRAAGDLLLAAGVGLATGAFLQVLWDDRPVTYPLTHLPWKGRERA